MYNCAFWVQSISHIILLESVLENTNHAFQDKWTDALAQIFFVPNIEILLFN